MFTIKMKQQTRDKLNVWRTRKKSESQMGTHMMKKGFLDGVLSLGHTDSQVVASGRKLNLRRDLRWVAERLASFFASTRKSQKKAF